MARPGGRVTAKHGTALGCNRTASFRENSGSSDARSHPGARHRKQRARSGVAPGPGEGARPFSGGMKANVIASTGGCGPRGAGCAGAGPGRGWRCCAARRRPGCAWGSASCTAATTRTGRRDSGLRGISSRRHADDRAAVGLRGVPPDAPPGVCALGENVPEQPGRCRGSGRLRLRAAPHGLAGRTGEGQPGRLRLAGDEEPHGRCRPGPRPP